MRKTFPQAGTACLEYLCSSSFAVASLAIMYMYCYNVMHFLSVQSLFLDDHIVTSVKTGR